MSTYSLYRDVDVIGVGENVNVEIWPIIREGERWILNDYDFQQPNEVVGYKVAIRVSDDPDVLITGIFDTVTVYAADEGHPRIRIEFK